MKPIILVIVSGAMLLLAMHRDINNENADPAQSSSKHKLPIKAQEKKLDTEILTHDLSIWLNRLQ